MRCSLAFGLMAFAGCGEAPRLGATDGAVPVACAAVGEKVDRGTDLPQARFSDHAPFWDVGIDAVMITDTALARNPHYHTPYDTFETLDPDFLVGVARGAAVAIGAASHACAD